VSAAIRSELMKLRTTRTFLGIVIATLGLVTLIGGAQAIFDPFDAGSTPGIDLLDVAGLAQPFALVLGILAVSTEFRHGTITPTLLATPDRTRLMVAKLSAHLTAGGVLGVVAYALAAVLMSAILPIREISTGISLGDGIEQVVGGIVCIALLAAIGVGVGAIVRNQVGAVIGGLAWMFMIEPLLSAIPTVGKWVEDYGIGGAIAAVSGSQFEGGADIGQVAGGLLLLGYALALAIAGAVLLKRRDISA
jgi:ABC-2 type transport system permease protein